MPRTGLVVLVPEAEAKLERHRRAHDAMAKFGVPAHVTVLYPFRSTIDDAARATLGEIAGRVASFEATFASVGRFPGETVFLAASPAEPFQRLSASLCEAFPDCPPYGGAFARTPPHLTVGIDLEARVADDLDRELRTVLPITTLVTQLTLLVEEDDGAWTIGGAWPLRDWST